MEKINEAEAEFGTEVETTRRERTQRVREKNLVVRFSGTAVSKKCSHKNPEGV
jgi:hypothetical protein